MDKNGDELIRKGNTLMAAAREGKIGFAESDIRALQNAYLRSRSGSFLTSWTPVFIIFIMGALTFISGSVQEYAALPRHTAAYQAATVSLMYGGQTNDDAILASVHREEQETGSQIRAGFLLIIGAVVYGVMLRKYNARGKKYVSFVQTEYPKLEKEAA